MSSNQKKTAWGQGGNTRPSTGTTGNKSPTGSVGKEPVGAEEKTISGSAPQMCTGSRKKPPTEVNAGVQERMDSWRSSTARETKKTSSTSKSPTCQCDHDKVIEVPQRLVRGTKSKSSSLRARDTSTPSEMSDVSLVDPLTQSTEGSDSERPTSKEDVTTAVAEVVMEEKEVQGELSVLDQMDALLDTSFLQDSDESNEEDGSILLWSEVQAAHWAAPENQKPISKKEMVEIIDFVKGQNNEIQRTLEIALNNLIGQNE
jgi:hypothetical protein